MDSVNSLQSWLPSIDEFEDIAEKVDSQFTTTRAAHSAIHSGDEVLAHLILFIHDSLLFWEFCNAIHDADMGRMWLVYDFWVFMM
jgi:hypothetical protein